MSELRASALDALRVSGNDERDLAYLLELGERQTRFSEGKTWLELHAWAGDVVDRYRRVQWDYELLWRQYPADADGLEAALETMWAIEEEAETAGFVVEDLAGWQRFDEEGLEVPF